ncbi:MAG: hypothetical protein EBU46_18460 [Nitrosomonadaceae bacterium]|nr:hypothetical protein [Nitrosomonadaceae bacterium]
MSSNSGTGNFSDHLTFTTFSGYAGSGATITIAITPNVSGVLTYLFTFTLSEIGSGFNGTENPSGSGGGANFTLEGSLSVSGGTSYYVTMIRPDYSNPETFSYLEGDVYLSPM